MIIIILELYSFIIIILKQCYSLCNWNREATSDYLVHLSESIDV